MIFKLMIPVFILLLLDSYVYKGVLHLSNDLSNMWKTIIRVVFWAVSIIVIGQFLNIFTHWQDYRVNRPEFVRFWSSVFFVVFFTKFSFLIFHLIDDIGWGLNTLFSSKPKTNFTGNPISRGNFITKIGLGVGALFLGTYSYGVIKGRYAFRVLREKMTFNNLPESFKGLRIVQISDLHLGSFINDFEEVEKAIPMINDLKPDLIFFTGDMVNVHSDEAEPWIKVFNKLEARMGKYSIFGNHDYCDYGEYTKEEKDNSISRLKEIHKEMGFRLMEDEHLFLEKDNEKIALIGMHNWGMGFHQQGSLEDSVKGLDDNHFQILLSHDPTLWEEKVKGKKAIDLTFSGHTHGMQMGVEIPFLGIKFSPIRMRYKKWAGLYSEGENHIYINRGFGFLGFPGRVGMAPEITLMELV